MPSNTVKKSKALKSGIVSIVGRPNVGKSTLLNAIIGEKVSITSDIPQTTRQQIRGIYNDERGQIVFIDTPGLHLGGDGLDKFMNRSSMGAMHGMDVIIHLTDSSEGVGKEENFVVNQLKKIKTPIIIGLNKVDYKQGKCIQEYIELWEQATGKSIHEIKNLTLLPLSALKNTNVDKLLDLVFELLPEGPLLYPEDVITDMPQRLAMADLIREKLFRAMREEVPHSIAVKIEHVSPRKGKVLLIKALIIVERETQKEIVIGKKGDVLKSIGTSARADLEELVGQKVFLELYVKTTKNWRDNPTVLEDMGYIFEGAAC